MRLCLFIGISFIQLLTSINSFGNGQNDTLIIGYYESPPFVMEDKEGVYGISYWLWTHVADELGLNYKLQEMQLNVVIDQLETGKIDMTINPLTITSSRSEIMDFSAPYFISNSIVMIRSVTSFEKGIQFLTSFLSMNFLRAILALFIVVFIFGTLAWVFERRNNPDEFHPGVRGLWSGLWWSAVTMTTVGYGDKSPRSTGGRLIALIWMFAAIIIISGFTASIASSLTVNQLSWNQSKIDDFKEKKVATVKGSATEKFLGNRFFKAVRSYPNLDECTKALENEKVVAIAYDEPQLRYISQFDSADSFQILPIQYNSQLYAFGFSEHLSHTLQEKITNELLKTTESTDWKVLLTEYGLLKD